MRKRRKNLPLIAGMTLGWLVCTMFFIFIGYCITGAIPITNINLNYFQRLLNVVSSPTDGYFNEYTPIGMIAGFILCEIIFAFILFMMNCRTKENGAEIMQEDPYLDPPDENEDMEFLFLDRAVGKEEKQIKEKGDKQEKAEKITEKISAKESKAEETEEEVMMQEQAFLELFSSGYSMPQITEMMEVTKYIKDIDVPLLKKMFKNNASPEEIRNQIESFYG